MYALEIHISRLHDCAKFFGESHRRLRVESEGQGESPSGEHADCQGIELIGNDV
jgi:hypothetical protein